MTWYVYDEMRPTKCIGQFEDADDACLFARLKAACKGYENGCNINLLFSKSKRSIPDGFSVVDFDERESFAHSLTRFQTGLRLRNKNEQQEKDV